MLEWLKRMLAWWRRQRIRERQWILAGLVTVAVVAMAATETGPFSGALQPVREAEGLFEVLLTERYTLGLVRLGLMALGLFIILSVPALIVAGRWLKGFSKEGLTADDAVAADEAIAGLQRQVRELTEERERLAEAATQTQVRFAALWQAIRDALGEMGPESEPPSGEDEE